VNVSVAAFGSGGRCAESGPYFRSGAASQVVASSGAPG
jgi:hypothetical protein